MAKANRTSGKKLKAAERRLQAVEMKKRGIPVADIAKKLGVSRTTIYKDLNKAIKNLNDAESGAKSGAVNHSPTESEENQLKAIELRRHGASYREIGRRIGVSHTQAFNYVRDYLEVVAKQETLTTEEMRQLMVERVNLARLAIVKQVVGGDLYAVDRWVKLNDQEIKLFGLNEPEYVAFRFDPELIAAMAMLDVEPTRAFEQFRQMIMAKANEVKSG